MTIDFRSPAKIWKLFSVAAFALVVVLLTVRAANRINQPNVRYPEGDTDAWALRDFRDAVYYPVRSLLDGISPYHVEAYVEKYPVGQNFPLYSPLTLALHLPFVWMPFEFSQWVYFGMTIALTVGLAWVSLWLCRLPCNAVTIFGLAAMILLTRPGHMNLLLGQTTLPLVLFSILGLHFARSRPWMAGLFLALSTFKPTYGVLLLVLAWAMGHRKSAYAGVAITACITAPMLLWVVAIQGGWEESLRIIRENGQLLYDNPGRDPSLSFSRIDAVALWARLIQATPSKILEFIISAGILGLGCLLLWRIAQKHSSQAVTTPSAALAMLVMLIAIYHHAYDALVMVPILLTAAVRVDDFWTRWPSGFRWIWCGLVAIPFANYVATNSIISSWEITGGAWIVVTCLNGAALLVATTWLAIALWRDSLCKSPDL